MGTFILYHMIHIIFDNKIKKNWGDVSDISAETTTLCTPRCASSHSAGRACWGSSRSRGRVQIGSVLRVSAPACCSSPSLPDDAARCTHGTRLWSTHEAPPSCRIASSPGTFRRCCSPSRRCRTAHHLQQCFFSSRNIGYVTPKNIYFHYLIKYFLDQSILIKNNK